MDFFSKILGFFQDLVKLIQNMVKNFRGDPTKWGENDFKVLKPGK